MAPLICWVCGAARRHTIVTSPNGQQDLANVHTGNTAIGLAPGAAHTSLQSIGTSARQHLVDADDVVWMGADTEVETFFASDFHEVSGDGRHVSQMSPDSVDSLWTYLLAQMRAASRASEDSCSYSLETMWMQRGNSSTFARLRPRSKIRILGSGTPRLKRDLGYGCIEIPNQSLQRNVRANNERSQRVTNAHNGGIFAALAPLH